jgi:hypothetical protein
MLSTFQSATKMTNSNLRIYIYIYILLMNTILLFKQDLERYPTNSLQILQRYFDLPAVERVDLLWLLAIHQAQNNRHGTMNGGARRTNTFRFNK